MSDLERECSEIDRHFAAFVCRLAGAEAGGGLHRAALLVSQAVGRGDVCVDLATAGPEGWWQGLSETTVVGCPGDYAPLIMDEAGLLYLYRYWRYERDLAEAILAKVQVTVPLDEKRLQEGLSRLFPACPDGVDWQLVAAVAAVRSRFAVVSGGPGTGKTSTVVKILALLLEQAAGYPCSIALAAPTGKAAVRLQASIRGARERLDVTGEVRERIPVDVVTLHRLLGAGGGGGRFRHHRDNPLPFEVVVVDEASMVALPLMARLVAALKPGCRLILLGDREQLASVEAGAVLGDICDTGRSHLFSPAFGALVQRVAGMELPSVEGERLADSLVILRRSYRFAPDSGIAAVSRLISAGDGDGALTAIRGDGSSSLVWRDAPTPQQLPEALAARVVEGFAPFLRAGSPTEALALFDRFRILCAVRQGPCGVQEVNRTVEGVLARAGLIDPQERWYRGRPIMVTANDYQLRLFNGDIGIVVPDRDGTPQVAFPSPDGGVRLLSPLRLPPFETVFAMTVHKSQGSEFDRILLLLPYVDTEICTRELIYTGMTRARGAVEFWGDSGAFVAAVTRRVQRASGLRKALWGRQTGIE